MLNSQERIQRTYVDFFGDVTRFWWDTFATTTRYALRTTASIYEIVLRPYPPAVTSALEAVYNENLERLNKVRDVLINETQEARDIAVSVTDQFVARTHEAQSAITDAAREAVHAGGSRNGSE
jgi:hypothetical protein